MIELEDLPKTRIPTSADIPEEETEESLDPAIQSVLDRRGIAALMDNPELRRIIDGALAGDLPLDRPLEVNQPKKLSLRAMQTILLAVGGYYTSQEIAAMSGMNYVYVTKLLKHPYARRILTIANASAADDFSNFSRRISRKTPKMLKIVSEIAEDASLPESTRLRAAFGWLDYAKPAAKEIENRGPQVQNNVFMVSGSKATLLSEAISEASRQKALPPVIDADFETIEEGMFEHPELEPEEAEKEGGADASKVA